MIPKETRKRIDRFQGALLGLLLGDAIGSLVDGWSQSAIRSRLGRIEGPRSRDDRRYLLGRLRRGEKPKKVIKSIGTACPPGLYYHFGQQALMAVECRLNHGDVGGESFARVCARLSSPSRRGKFGLHRKPSPVFRTSISRFIAGEDWRESGEESSRTDCIPAALVVGLAYGGKEEELSRRAAEIALVTDRTPYGIMSAVAFAHLTDLVAGLDPLSSPHDVLQALLERLDGTERSVREHLGEIEPPSPEEFPAFRKVVESLAPLWIGPREEGEEEGEDRIAVQSLVRSISRLTSRPEGKINATFAPAGLCAASYFALTETQGPGRAILTAVNAGGRTLALGSLTGGIAGARWGRRAFPRDWVDFLWNGAEVIRMGESLAFPREDRPWKGDLHALEMKANERYRDFKDELKKEILGGNLPDSSE